MGTFAKARCSRHKPDDQLSFLSPSSRAIAISRILFRRITVSAPGGSFVVLLECQAVHLYTWHCAAKHDQFCACSTATAGHLHLFQSELSRAKLRSRLHGLSAITHCFAQLHAPHIGSLQTKSLTLGKQFPMQHGGIAVNYQTSMFGSCVPESCKT